MTDPYVRRPIPNSYVDQKDGFSNKKPSSPLGWKRKSGGGEKWYTEREETWRDKKITRQFGEKGKS